MCRSSSSSSSSSSSRRRISIEKAEKKSSPTHGDAMKQFETLLAESIKSIDDVETMMTFEHYLPRSRCLRHGGPLSEGRRGRLLDAFLLEFKTNSLQRYAELCRETVSALSQSSLAVADEEDAIFAWEIAPSSLKEDALRAVSGRNSDVRPLTKRWRTFGDERIRNAGTTGCVV